MPGPNPKPSHIRQRRNKHSTRATLEAPAGKVKVPKLPARGRGRGAWHPRVKSWWNQVWRSPMASEYLDVHRHGLEAIAELWQTFHTAKEPSKLLALHAEIRQAQKDYGLTPMDLRRLQWEIKRADEKKPAKSAAKPAKKEADPRKLLRLVK